MSKPRVLVFGEYPNDTHSIAELVRCVRGDLEVKCRREPIILDRNAARDKRIRNFSRVAAVVRAEPKPVRAVVVHRDCDAVEPAHVRESDRIENEARSAFGDVDVTVVPATPAFELEAWWYLFPDAVAAYRPKWRRLNRDGKEVGKIVNAKETLVRDLRPSEPSRVRDYTESDAPQIAKRVKDLNICETPRAKSASFDLFVQKLRSL